MRQRQIWMSGQYCPSHAGRKSKGDTRTMAFRLSKEVADIIERTANELGVTRTKVVEMAIKIASQEGI